jgi:hypothetical protein
MAICEQDFSSLIKIDLLVGDEIRKAIKEACCICFHFLNSSNLVGCWLHIS